MKFRGSVKIAIAFLLLIIIFGTIGWVKYNDIRMRSGYQGKLLEAWDLWKEAKDLRDLNALRSKELAQDAKSKVRELSDLGVEDRRLEDLREDMEEVLPLILGEYFVHPGLILDMGLVEKEFSPTDFATASKRVFVFDEGLGKIVSFNFEGRETRVFEARDVVKGTNLAAAGSRIFLRDGQRVAEVTENEARSVALSDGAWGEVLFVLGFGGNLYVGDENQVWKYSPSVSGGFGSGIAWLRETAGGVYQDAIAGAMSVAIDSSLWILGQDGQVTKLIQGRQDFFAIRDLDKPFSDPRLLHTRVDLENLYVLDSGNKRVVVLDKGGEYKAQYSWDEMSRVTQIAVSEEEKKMLFFVGSKVYKVDLKNGGDAGICRAEETSSSCAQ